MFWCFKAQVYKPLIGFYGILCISISRYDHIRKVLAAVNCTCLFENTVRNQNLVFLKGNTIDLE